MTVNEMLHIGQQAPPLRFIVIGGFAVSAHGHFRTTNDVDFLVRREDREAWIARVEASGFTKIHETQNFAQYKQELGLALDLMFVNEETWEKLWSASIAKPLEDVVVHFPDLKHLIALKVHVLNQGLTHRTFKDAWDVEMLARRNNLDLTLPEFEELFLSHGKREIYETFIRILKHPETPGPL